MESKALTMKHESWLPPHLESVLKNRSSVLASWRQQVPTKAGRTKNFEGSLVAESMLSRRADARSLAGKSPRFLCRHFLDHLDELSRGSVVAEEAREESGQQVLAAAVGHPRPPAPGIRSPAKPGRKLLDLLGV